MRDLLVITILIAIYTSASVNKSAIIAAVESKECSSHQDVPARLERRDTYQYLSLVSK